MYHNYYMIFKYFSYWIFIWYILYVLHVIKYNPKIALLFALSSNILLLIVMILCKTTAHLVFLLLLMMLLLKIIPLYTIWHTKISKKDVWVFVLLLVVYIVFMIMNKQYIDEFINNIIDLIIYKKNTLPLMQQLEKMGL